MNNTAVSINPAPKAAPAVVVFGRDDSGKSHASWFAEADAPLAEKAAAMMGMAALRAATSELQALAGQLPQGRVFASGRAFVPFVKVALYDRLAAHLPHPATPPLRLIGDDPEQQAPADTPAEPGKPDQELLLPDDWSKITVGSFVLAREDPAEGWFEARVQQVKGKGLFILKWRDWPELPEFVRRVDHVALLHPSAASLT